MEMQCITRLHFTLPIYQNSVFVHLIGYFEVRDIDISLQIVKVMNFDIFLQIVQLTASGNFEEALSLCKLLPPEESSLRAAKEGSIHIRLFTIMDYSF
jgi:hypothetical protein